MGYVFAWIFMAMYTLENNPKQANAPVNIKTSDVNNQEVLGKFMYQLNYE